MNNMSKAIFDIAHVCKNVRDTLEYCIDREHPVAGYENKKKVLSLVLDQKSILGKFIEDNAEKLADFKKKYEEFMDEIYSEHSTVLVPNGENVRVDHAQNEKILNYVISISETLRDILANYIQYTKSQKDQYEESMNEFIFTEERFDRVLKTFVIMQEYQKKFFEFQKVMSESKGQPTPQSNYIAQSELAPMASAVRFVRAHAKCIDNNTLDKLDLTIQLIEMSEGRRERRDNRSFPDLFRTTLETLAGYINELGPKYDQLYQAGVKEMMADMKPAPESQQA